MKINETFFKEKKDHTNFMIAINERLRDLSFEGERKIEFRTLYSSMIIIFEPYKSLPKESYYIRFNKVGQIALNKS